MRARKTSYFSVFLGCCCCCCLGELFRTIPLRQVCFARWGAVTPFSQPSIKVHTSFLTEEVSLKFQREDGSMVFIWGMQITTHILSSTCHISLPGPASTTLAPSSTQHAPVLTPTALWWPAGSPQDPAPGHLWRSLSPPPSSPLQVVYLPLCIPTFPHCTALFFTNVSPESWWVQGGYSFTQQTSVWVADRHKARESDG